jgi:DNA invertase Pin-like site-specific DNA recombinase
VRLLSFERAMLRERTKAGLDNARRQGRIGDRRPKLRPHQQVEIVKMVSKGRKTAANAARLFKVHPATMQMKHPGAKPELGSQERKITQFGHQAEKTTL